MLPQSASKYRLKSLDWLRGLMALSIMLYHLGGRNDAATPLGKLGVYGVSVFFILSGLSIAIAYDRYIKDLRSAVGFFVRRLFRIWPMLWIAVILVAVPAYYSNKSFSASMIGLNLSTLFGFIAPTKYINMGAWSIGNEMVYYALTPPFIAAYHWRKWLGNVITLAAASVGIFFAFHLMTNSATLETQWSVYINPLNNLFLYCAGLAIYFNFSEKEVPSRWHLPLLLLSVSLFFFYPSSGDQVNLVTGLNRVALSFIALAIAFTFYKCPPVLPSAIGVKFEQLGIATYGVYLLHPIVIEWTGKFFKSVGVSHSYLVALLVVVLTIAISLVTFRCVESPLIKLGKLIT
jgi:exopolysaccharide production protein ExoZ